MPLNSRGRSGENLLGMLLGIRRENKLVEEDWGTDNSTLSEYSETFSELLSGNSLEDTLDQMKMMYRRVYVLELMGSGVAFNGLGLSGVCSVTLGENGRGDLLSKKTWKGISDWQKSKASGNNFNLIICRPVGGVHTIPDSNELFGFFLSECWSRLSQNGGVLLSQLPGSLGNPSMSRYVTDWIEEANRNIPGFYARYQHSRDFGPSRIASIRIDKGYGAPKEFPTLFR